MSPPTLDSLLATARAATVPADVAQRRVAELERWARPQPRAPWWRAGLLVFAGAAAAVAGLWLWWRATPPPIVPLGDRVALIAEPGAQYRVVATDRGHTEVLVESGTVTARLWKGQGHHALALRGGGVIAAATGTIYSLTIERGHASVRVHEGTVEVRSESAGIAPARIIAGASWPAAEPSHGVASARRLQRLRPPSAVESVASDAGAAAEPLRDGASESSSDAGPEVVPGGDAGIAAVPPTDAVADAGTGAAPGTAPIPNPGSRPARERASPDAGTTNLDAGSTAGAAQATSADRWRLARLRRGQGKFREALAECLAIADSADPTWAPIALVEAARLTLGPLAEPHQTLELSRRMRSSWPKHTLLTEMRAIECRALKQLGRATECAVVERMPASQ